MFRWPRGPAETNSGVFEHAGWCASYIGLPSRAQAKMSECRLSRRQPSCSSAAGPMSGGKARTTWRQSNSLAAGAPAATAAAPSHAGLEPFRFWWNQNRNSMILIWRVFFTRTGIHSAW